MADVEIIMPQRTAILMTGWISAMRGIGGEWEPEFVADFMRAVDGAKVIQRRAATGVVDVPLPAGPVPEGERDDPGTMTDTQAELLKTAFDAAEVYDSADRLNLSRSLLNAPELESSAQLSFNQAAGLIGKLSTYAKKGADHA